MNVLITGAGGFIGKNLIAHLRESNHVKVLRYKRGDSFSKLTQLIQESDFIVHLAGEMRPPNPDDLFKTNYVLTHSICNILRKQNRVKSILLASTIQAGQDNPYGVSKLSAEREVIKLANETEVSAIIYRLPHVFGKWSKPNYNSVIATFCYNVANDLPLKINDPKAIIYPVHIDNVVADFISAINENFKGFRFGSTKPVYKISVGDLADKIMSFNVSRADIFRDGYLGDELTYALYSSYLTYLPVGKFSFRICSDNSPGNFHERVIEAVKSNQFSCYTVLEGECWGGHYHHLKSQIYIVLKGGALFRFRNVITSEIYEIEITANMLYAVESIPGWVLDIINLGSHDLIVAVKQRYLVDEDMRTLFRDCTMSSPG